MSEEIGRRSTANFREPPRSTERRLPGDIPEIYEFGSFRLEPAERKLLRGNEAVALTPKAFDTLHLLVRNSGHLLEKDELIRMLWPDSFVEEGNLTNNIFLLRKALGEDPQYIETVPKKGYRFVGGVRRLPTAHQARSEIPPDGEGKSADKMSGALHPPDLVVVPSPSSARRTRRVLAGVAITALVMAGVGGAIWWRSSTRLADRSQWVQLTKLPDSATQPALSPDGRMLAFVRSPSTWIGAGQIYVKMLPGGEPVQLTHDDLIKADPTFSPDGSRIAYTTLDPRHFAWDTWVVPTLRGEPQLMMRNASGLTWTGPRQVLFSEIKTAVHMGIVAADESRLGARDIYLPTDAAAMAHRSYLSPDGKWVVLAEMDQDHEWLPCRLVPMDGHSRGRPVGPLAGSCTSAAWSRDGKWMYFAASPGGANHIWRQRFPDGQPEQVTSGPTEEEGIAISSDGDSLITAVALQSTSLWIHDGKGERQILLEGNGKDPIFTPDGKKLCYLIAKEATSKFAWFRNPSELRVVDLGSGSSQVVVSGFDVHDYDVSRDGKQVVIATTDEEGKHRLWVAQLDRSLPPTQVPNVEGVQPIFGARGEIFFRRAESAYRVRADGTGLRRAVEAPVYLIWSISPDGRWIVAWGPLHDNGTMAMQAFSLDGERPIQIGDSFTSLTWTLDGRSALLAGSYFVPLAPGESLPPIPEGGFASEEAISRLPGARRINEGGLVPGPTDNVYAFYRGTIQRNLYRIPLRGP
jgi:DNA-binding winged helix-turn-helix (wHTH) protein/Tol biopolymer transport system component